MTFDLKWQLVVTLSSVANWKEIQFKEMLWSSMSKERRGKMTNADKNRVSTKVEIIILKVRDQITFLTPQLTSKFLRFWYQQTAHIFLIHILKFGVPKFGIYEEIIKNVSNK